MFSRVRAVSSPFLQRKNIIHNIKKERTLAIAEMRRIVGKAKAEKRNLRGDEASKFDAFKVKITDLERLEAGASFLGNAKHQ
jgi:hypothetical protein